MNKIEEARQILEALGMPKQQQADLCCYSLLAMLGITPDTKWKDATNEWIRIHDILMFTKEYYEVAYAENSRETFRKQAMHHFRNAALTEDNDKANYIIRQSDFTSSKYSKHVFLSSISNIRLIKEATFTFSTSSSNFNLLSLSNGFEIADTGLIP